MEEKRNAWITVLFLCWILLMFTAADFLHSERTFSENENRVLASRPEASVPAILDGSFMKKYEEYVTDQFVSRDTWIQLKTRGDLLLQKKEINGIYLGKSGYLFERHLPADIPEEKVERRLALLESLTDRWGAMVMLVPTADNILTDKLPANAPFYDQEELLDRVKARVGEEHVVDVFPILREHASEEIYYRTDHHWTSLGAYYGYCAWMEKCRKIPSFLYHTDKMETVTSSFLGTLHSRVNLPIGADRMQYFPETERRPLSVRYDFNARSDTYYEEKYLDTKNKYGFFLDDNHPFVEIDTGFTNGRELFLIKDSYANCFVPLLTGHYEKIYVLDLRYFNGKLFEFMDSLASERERDVLVLYNCIQFIEDFQYY